MGKQPESPKHAGVIGGALVTATFGTVMWIFPDLKQPYPGMEGAFATLATAIIGWWMSRKRGGGDW